MAKNQTTSATPEVAPPTATVVLAPAAALEATQDYVVMRPLKRDGKDYEPGDPITLTDRQAAPLRARKVVALPGEKVELNAAEAARLVELQVLGPAKK